MILSVCPYTHLWRVIRTAIAERRFPAAARQGAIIMLVGILCPLFWIAYFSGASKKELIFHACHSGIFVLVGMVLMIRGLMKK
jgi:hypothetical protein